MKKLLVLQHVAHEVLGTLNPLLKRSGFRIRCVNFARHPDARPSLDGYDGLVVLGGPMSANDSDRLPNLMTEMKLIEEALGKNLPVLGICLGAQLIARTLGAAVYPNQQKEIGWYDISPTEDAGRDPLLSALAETEKIFQWHGGAVTPERIHSETPAHIERLAQLSELVFGEFIKLFGIDKKFWHLPSR